MRVISTTMVSHNDVFVTVSGRHTSPHPKIYKTPSRSLLAHREWLKNEAIEEARVNKDDFNLVMSEGLNPKNWSQSDQDLTLLYLFGCTKTLKRIELN